MDIKLISDAWLMISSGVWSIHWGISLSISGLSHSQPGRTQAFEHCTLDFDLIVPTRNSTRNIQKLCFVGVTVSLYIYIGTIRIN